MRLPEPGEQMGRYQVMAHVAHGGMAVVYAVRRRDVGGFDKLLAMKVLLPHLGSDPRFVDMFLDEARIAAQVDHPNVVSVFDMGVEERTPYLVMEYLRGQSLSTLVKRTAALPDGPQPNHALLSHVLAEAAAGLDAAHRTLAADGTALNIVHRDVSPQNMHIGYDGRVRVVDFGIAAAKGRITSTATGEIKGKLAYLAPEQLDHSYPVDHRADVWALGVVAWQLFARRSLFRGDSDADTIYNLLNRNVPDLRLVDADIPDAIADCVASCLQRRPARRPESAAAVAEIFRKVASEADDVRAELSSIMRAVFEEDRIQESALLSAAAENSAVARPLVSPEVPTLAAPAPARRWPYGLLAGALLAIAAGAVYAASDEDEPTPPAMTTAHDSTAPPTRSAPAADEAVAEAPLTERNPGEASAQSPSTAESILSVSVDPRARLVLVDGVRHDERPLMLSFEDREPLEVVLIGPDGEERFEVGPGFAEPSLTLSEPSPGRRARRRRRAPTPVVARDPSLLPVTL